MAEKHFHSKPPLSAGYNFSPKIAVWAEFSHSCSQPRGKKKFWKGWRKSAKLLLNYLGFKIAVFYALRL